MPDVNNVQKFVTPSQFASYVKPLRNDVDALAQTVHVSHNVITSSVTSWADVQTIVRAGLADKAFPIGTKMYCHRGNGLLEWDVIGIDHDTPADPRFTHSLTLQLHYCFPTVMQFDAPEAFYYCETALEAGTYHFTVGSTEYQFTLAEGIPAGSQLILVFNGDTPTGITVSATKDGAVVGDTIPVSAGSGGSELLNINDFERSKEGSGNYKESAIRQWLNSSAAAGSVWTPQTDFDRPPKWHTGEDGTTKQAGFLNDMDADFLSVIGKTKVKTALSPIDGGGFIMTNDKFFLLSSAEVYGSRYHNEGAAYPFYSDYSEHGDYGNVQDSNRVKFKSGVAQIWSLRTPNAAHAPASVNVNGAIGSYGNAKQQKGVAPACNII